MGWIDRTEGHVTSRVAQNEIIWDLITLLRMVYNLRHRLFIYSWNFPCGILNWRQITKSLDPGVWRWGDYGTGEFSSTPGLEICNPLPMAEPRKFFFLKNMISAQWFQLTKNSALRTNLSSSALVLCQVHNGAISTDSRTEGGRYLLLHTPVTQRPRTMSGSKQEQSQEHSS